MRRARQKAALLIGPKTGTRRIMTDETERFALSDWRHAASRVTVVLRGLALMHQSCQS